MPIYLTHDRMDTANLIDANGPWMLTPEQSKKSSNQILKLRHYHAGLAYLYGAVREVELATTSAATPRTPVPAYCMFEWYAVTASNYTDLVASIAIDHGLLAPTPDRRKAIDGYTASALGNVNVFRNKVAAHTAYALPRRSDNEADRDLSVLPSMPTVNGRFVVGAYRIANSKGSSQHDYSWSLTKFHEDFVRRFLQL